MTFIDFWTEYLALSSSSFIKELVQRLGLTTTESGRFKLLVLNARCDYCYG